MQIPLNIKVWITPFEWNVIFSKLFCCINIIFNRFHCRQHGMPERWTFSSVYFYILLDEFAWISTEGLFSQNSSYSQKVKTWLLSLSAGNHSESRVIALGWNLFYACAKINWCLAFRISEFLGNPKK